MTELDIGRGPERRPLGLRPDHLRTHAVIVGMTGSGKTGLALVLLEELIAAGVPVVAIDPKGDLGNLGLLFPDFRPEDFAPWCGRNDPAETAQRWQAGLLKAGITADRVRELRERMALTVYTPGSTAGVPINLLGLLAPPTGVDVDADVGEAVEAAVSGLLGLAGRKNPDPIRDPAHVVLSRIVGDAWRSQEALELSTLVLRLVDPPFEKVGVFPLDTFFPPDDRMELAMAFNAILAAPSFAAWRTGVGLDPARLLDRSGKVPVSVFSLSHLGDGERQFFVSLLAARLLAWSRSQPGTEDLRAMVFLDEAAGYLPPHPHAPPSKAPLVTLMKQARAVGLGVTVATQNPVDLDYKALSNAGVWCIGRLTTEQDRNRLLKGIDARALDGEVARLEKRQFVLHRVGKDPTVFDSRHAMAYLRGPLTPPELGTLMDLWGGVPDGSEAAAATPAAGPAGPATATAEPADAAAHSSAPPTIEGYSARFLDPRVVFSARLKEVFEPHAEATRADGRLVFRPALRAEARLRFDETKGDYLLDETLERVWFPLDGPARPEAALPVRFEAADLLDAPPEGARFAPLPAWMDEANEMKRLARDLEDELYRTESRGQFVNVALGLHARADEDEASFRERCRAAVEAAIDARAAKLSSQLERKAERIQDKLDKKRAEHAEREGLARSRQLEEVVNLGATVLSFFGGRKRSLTTAVSKRRQSAREAARVDRLEAEIVSLEEEARALEDELREALVTIRAEEEAALDATEAREVRLEKNDVEVRALEVLWIPVTRRV